MYAIWLWLFIIVQVNGFGFYPANVWKRRVSRINAPGFLSRQGCCKVDSSPVAPKTYEEYCTMLDEEFYAKKIQYELDVKENLQSESPKSLGPPPERMAYEFTTFHPQRLKDWNALVAAKRKQLAKQRKLNKDKPPTFEIKLAETNFHSEKFDFVHNGKITQIANCAVPRW